MYVRMDQCEAVQAVEGPDVPDALPAMKTTGWVTNSMKIAEALDRFQCRNRLATCDAERHQHGSLFDGKSANTERHPRAIVNAVLTAFAAELRERGRLAVNNFEVGYNLDAEPFDWEDPVAEFEEYYTTTSVVLAWALRLYTRRAKKRSSLSTTSGSTSRFGSKTPKAALSST